MPYRTRFVKAAFLAVLIAALTGCSFGGEKTPSVLLSNDDGIDAPGLLALADTLAGLGTVTVAAPLVNRSGTSHGVTSRDPIEVRESMRKGITWFGIDALPATCVRLAIEALLPEKPDLVVSGINRGENVGTVAFYSATVACAREAAFLGITALSVNLEAGRDMNYRDAAEFVRALVARLSGEGLPRGTYLNINVPALDRGAIRGVRITRQDAQAPIEIFKKITGPDGKTIYLPSYKTLDAGEEGTDIWAVKNGYISITPFAIDQTHEPGLTGLKALENLEWKGPSPEDR